MKMPMCACGHKLAEHCNDEGKGWDKHGFCSVGWFTPEGAYTDNGCHCAEFTLKLRGTA